MGAKKLRTNSVRPLKGAVDEEGVSAPQSVWFTPTATGYSRHGWLPRRTAVLQRAQSSNSSVALAKASLLVRPLKGLRCLRAIEVRPLKGAADEIAQQFQSVGFRKASLIGTTTKCSKTLALTKPFVLSLLLISNTIMPYLPFATAATASAMPATKLTKVDGNDKSQVDSAILESFNNPNSQAKPDGVTMAADLASLNAALQANAVDQGITVSLDTNKAQLSYADNAVMAAKVTTNVKTAMPGYTLTVNTTGNSNSLLNTTDNTKTIDSTTGTQASPKPLANGQWGYALAKNASNSFTANFDASYKAGAGAVNANAATTKWAAVPSSTQTPATLKHTTAAPDATKGDSTDVYYGLNLSNASAETKLAGDYQAQVQYTATANILDPPVVEKVTPDTISQSVTMGGIAVGYKPAYTDEDGKEYPATSHGACYLTDKGNAYCSDASGLVAKWNLSAYDATPMTHRCTNSSAYDCTWLKVSTERFDGKVGSSTATADYNLTITGSKLANVTNVYVDINKNGQQDSGEECTNLKITSDKQLTCTAPKANPGTYDLYLENITSSTKASIIYQ